MKLFESNMDRAKDLVSTSIALRRVTTPVVDLDDLLRAALVQGVSTFDHYIHEEVLARMIEIYGSVRPSVQGFEDFRISINSLRVAQAHGGTSWLESEIRSQHRLRTFQQPEKIAEVFRCVSNASLWNDVAHILKRPVADVKIQLKLVVDRRNKIAHESDMDPTPPRERYPITDSLVTTSLDFLDAIAHAILTVV